MASILLIEKLTKCLHASVLTHI